MFDVKSLTIYSECKYRSVTELRVPVSRIIGVSNNQ